MPSRRRPKAPPSAPPDPIAQFATMLRQSAEQERVDQERRRIERADAEAAARAADEHADALAAARRDLERAIEGARIARRDRKGIDVADAAWRRAKARLIELETGAPPPWAQPAGDRDDHDDHDDHDDNRSGGTDDQP